MPMTPDISNMPRLLATSSVAQALTGTSNETALATISIPAGALGLNGGIEIRTCWTITNSANTKTLRIRLGGIGGTAFRAIALTTNLVLSDVYRIRNRGSASSQVGSFAAANTVGVGVANSALSTGAINTAVAQDLVLSGQLASSGETITLESYEVWLLPG